MDVLFEFVAHKRMRLWFVFRSEDGAGFPELVPLDEITQSVLLLSYGVMALMGQSFHSRLFKCDRSGLMSLC